MTSAVTLIYPSFGGDIFRFIWYFIYLHLIHLLVHSHSFTHHVRCTVAHLRAVFHEHFQSFHLIYTFDIYAFDSHSFIAIYILFYLHFHFLDRAGTTSASSHVHVLFGIGANLWNRYLELLRALCDVLSTCLPACFDCHPQEQDSLFVLGSYCIKQVFHLKVGTS